MKELKETEIIKYKVFTMRLHEETKKKLIEGRKKSGKSWNLYLMGLIENKRNKQHETNLQ